MSHVCAICLCVKRRPTFEEPQHISSLRQIKSGDLESSRYIWPSHWPATWTLPHTSTFLCHSLWVYSKDWISLFLISIHNLWSALRQWRRGQEMLMERDWSIKPEVKRMCFLPPTIKHQLSSSSSLLPVCFIYILTVLTGTHTYKHAGLFAVQITRYNRGERGIDGWWVYRWLDGFSFY